MADWYVIKKAVAWFAGPYFAVYTHAGDCGSTFIDCI